MSVHRNRQEILTRMPRPAAIPKRASGVFLPVFSLPSGLDQGDFGPGAERWLRWLASAGQRYWMILPIGPVDSTGSPYAADSAFALNPLLVSPEILVRQKLLPPGVLNRLYPALDRRTAAARRWALLQQAWQQWSAQANRQQQRTFLSFCLRQAAWLDPYAQFAALKHRYHQQPWWRWAKQDQRYPIRQIDGRLADHIALVKFGQWQAAAQWSAVRRLAQAKNIQIISDLPFTVRHDSADVWSESQLFSPRTGRGALVSGMPPDQFSRRGQRWGTPLFHWPAHRRQKFRWWAARLANQLQLADLIRLDHWQGFIREWAIPAKYQDGRVGHWVKSPGAALWYSSAVRRLRIRAIAEDLGLPLPAADRLRQHLGFPGIRLFPFSWTGWPGNIHALSAIRPDLVYMTSNHDLPSVREWWTRVAKPYERRNLRPHLDGQPPWLAAVRIVLTSPSQLAILSAADIFGVGRAARLNHPGQRRGNWRWQLPAWMLTTRAARQIRQLSRAAGR